MKCRQGHDRLEGKINDDDKDDNDGGDNSDLNCSHQHLGVWPRRNAMYKGWWQWKRARASGRWCDQTKMKYRNDCDERMNQNESTVCRHRIRMWQSRWLIAMADLAPLQKKGVRQVKGQRIQTFNYATNHQKWRLPFSFLFLFFKFQIWLDQSTICVYCNIISWKKFEAKSIRGQSNTENGSEHTIDKANKNA